MNKLLPCPICKQLPNIENRYVNMQQEHRILHRCPSNLIPVNLERGVDWNILSKKDLIIMWNRLVQSNFMCP